MNHSGTADRHAQHNNLLLESLVGGSRDVEGADRLAIDGDGQAPLPARAFEEDRVARGHGPADRTEHGHNLQGEADGRADYPHRARLGQGGHVDREPGAVAVDRPTTDQSAGCPGVIHPFELDQRLAGKAATRAG